MTASIDRGLLQETAHAILISDLQERGNQLSVLHCAALRVLMGTMADYAAKADQGRKAIALPTGMGKTSAVVAFILAIERLGYVVPVAVAASKVEALCAIKRELVSRGVPESAIGLKHRVSEASLPSTGNDDRRYMFVTHSRVNRGTDYELFGKHQGRDRALLIWDETLLRSEAISIDVRTLRAAAGALSAYGTDHGMLSSAMDYLRDCLSRIEEAMADLHDKGDPQALGALLELAERSDTELMSYAKAVAATGMPRPYVDAVAALFEAAQEPLRVVAVGTSEGVIWSRENIPELLRNVLVLDASYPIRALVQLDASITEVSTFPASDLKRFDAVTVVQLLAAGGRSSVARSSRDSVRERSDVVSEVVDVIKSEWATSRGILVFTFKQRSSGDPDHFRDLKARLRCAGLDPEQMVSTGEVDPQGKPVLRTKLQGLTYGQETSLNGFEFCDVVILAGVLHRSELDIAAAMKGQIGRLSAPTPFCKVQEVVQSEVAHVVYQALSRGSCRRIRQGMAEPMRGYLIHRSRKLEATLSNVMPGAKWEVREPTYLKPANAEDVAADAAAAILGFLRGLPRGTDSVACRVVSAALKVEPTPRARQAFTRGGTLVEASGTGWAKVGSSFKRNAARYGFMDRTPSLVEVDTP